MSLIILVFILCFLVQTVLLFHISSTLTFVQRHNDQLRTSMRASILESVDLYSELILINCRIINNIVWIYVLFADTTTSRVHLDDYYELFFSRKPSTQWPLPPSTPDQSKKVTKLKYKDPESKENIDKFTQEIQQLGQSSTLSDQKYNAVLINSESNRRIEKLEKSSWKRTTRNQR